VETGAPWTCAACGSGNAGYRRRCIDCGVRRAAGMLDPAADEPEAEGPVVPADIPLPGIARRRDRRGRRWPGLVLTASVLALATWGAIQYLAAERPSAAVDQAALVAALSHVGELRQQAVLFDPRIDPAAGPECPAVADELAELVADHATAGVIAGSPGTRPDIVAMAFDSARNADRYAVIIYGGDASFCGEDPPRDVAGRSRGRAVLVVFERDDVPDVFRRFFDNLELEG
jgi:hypothetical protein